MKNLVTLILITFSAGATTLHVPSEYSNIFAAISASQDGDTVLVAPGQYGGGFGFQGKNIVVRSSAGAGNTYLESPFSDYHCVMFTGGEDSTAVLEGFSITNGNFDGESEFSKGPPDYGGGIYIYESSPTIRNCRIVNCGAGMGAGIYINYSSARIIGCTISNNVACINNMRGGGLFAGRSGPAGPPVILNCDIHSNDAQYGGGIQVEASFVQIINNSIHDNYSIHESGGINVWGSGPEILSNFISGNDGGAGGGIRIDGGKATIIGNMIVENIASYGGGFGEYSSGNISIENNTIVCNTANVRGGGLQSKNDSISITNSIIWGNNAPIGSQIYLLAFADSTQAFIEYSNIEYGQDSIFLDTNSTLDWGPGNIDLDPLFETGPLYDYHLSVGSPCIDAGNSASEYNDPEDPLNPGYAIWPAMGYLRNDMGAFGGSGINYWLSVVEEGASLEVGTLPLHIFPNPFSSSCTISYQLEEASQVNLSVFDLSGRLVKTLTNEHLHSGRHSEYFDGSNLCSGVYLIKLVAGDAAASRRCVVVR